MNIEVAKLQSLSDRVMEVEITSHGVWKSLSLLFQCTGAGLIVTLFVSLSGETTSGFGAKIPDLLQISKFRVLYHPKANFVQMRGGQNKEKFLPVRNIVSFDVARCAKFVRLQSIETGLKQDESIFLGDYFRRILRKSKFVITFSFRVPKYHENL